MKSPTVGHYILPLLLLIFISGCDLVNQLPDQQSSSSDLQITTDEYQYAALDTVTVRFNNETGESVWLLNDGCGTPGGKPLPYLKIEKREGDQWMNRTSHGCVALYQAPKKLEGKGYQVSFRVGIVGEPLEPGTYRYKFDIRRGAERPGEPESRLRESLRVSNTFEIEANGEGIVFQTGQQTYDPGNEVELQLENESDDVFRVGSWCELRLHKQIDGEWQQVWKQESCYAAVVKVEPGEQVEHVATLPGGLSEGTYRYTLGRAESNDLAVAAE